MTAKGMRYEAPQHTLCVQLQARRRNWDYMPETVLKPYAISTISHVAEMAVLLGVRWKTFDPDSWNLRAEGNGQILTSAVVQGLGVAISFIITGPQTFEADRIIPCHMVKDLLFGTVPTIFQSHSLKLDLEFGDKQDIRRALKLLKCDQETVERYVNGRRDHVRSGKRLRVWVIG